MESLDHSYKQRLEHALGWLELANVPDAMAELRDLPDTVRQHPDTLEVRWKIHAAQQDWGTCVAISRILTDLAPERASAWKDLVVALNAIGCAEEAYVILSGVLGRFRGDCTLRLAMAHLCVSLEKHSEANAWLSIVGEHMNAQQCGRVLA